MLKGLFAGEVEDEEGAAGSTKVGSRDGLVGFLASRVPEGELHVFLGSFAGVAGWFGEAI